MTNENVVQELVAVAGTLHICVKRLGKVFPDLNPLGQTAIKRIITDLNWAQENCTVVALHREGRAQDDRMGISEEQIKRELGLKE